MSASESWEYKYSELKRKGIKIYTILDSDQSIDEDGLFDEFKSFCISCTSLGDWLKNNKGKKIDYKRDTYLDICRGVANGDKHYQITRCPNTYKSTYYRTSTPNLFQSSTGCADDSTNLLHKNPRENALVVETQQNTFSIREIIDNCIKKWDSLLS